MVYEAMKRALAPLGIYRGDAEALSHELAAYSAELEALYEKLGLLMRERFIGTAEDIGLAVYEELFGPVRTGESAQSRREMLRLRMNLGEGDFTPAGMRRAMDSLGVSCQISEFPTLNKLNITATSDCSHAMQAFIRREAEKLAPAHLEFQITFNTLTWSEIDGLDLTFAQSDASDLSWNELDNRTHEDIE